MTVLRPCIGCTERFSCEIKRNALAAMRGQKITSANIKCDLPYTKHFPRGIRVRVMVWDWNNMDHDGQVSGNHVPATVYAKSTKKRGKLLCRLDAPILLANENEGLWTTAWPKDLIKFDEPMAELCECGAPLINGACDQFVHLKQDLMESL